MMKKKHRISIHLDNGICSARWVEITDPVKKSAIITHDYQFEWGNNIDQIGTLIQETDWGCSQKVLSQTKIILGLPIEQLMFKKLNFNTPLKERELKRYLEQRSPELFGAALNALYYDYQTMLSPQNENKMVAWVIAAKKSRWQSCIASFEQAGLALDAIEPDLLGLSRLNPNPNLDPNPNPQGILVHQKDFRFVMIKKGKQWMHLERLDTVTNRTMENLEKQFAVQDWRVFSDQLSHAKSMALALRGI